QAAAVAVGARLIAAVAGEKDPDLDLVLLGLEPAEESDDTLELVVSQQHQAAVVLAQLGPGHVHRDAAPPCKLAQLLHDRPVVRPVPRLDRTFTEALRLIGN